MSDFFEPKNSGGAKLLRGVSTAGSTIFRNAPLIVAFLAVAIYFAVKMDYADTRGEGRTIKVYTINKLTGIVCETQFTSNQTPTKTCL